MTTIIITDGASNSKAKQIVSHGFVPVPRIGEQVEWFYNPAPKVQRVLYNYDKPGETVVYVVIG